MLERIKLNNKNLEILYNKKFTSGTESDTYFALYKNENKVIKLFNDKDAIENKVKKITLLKDRLKNNNCVITADAFITDKDKIIGYMMPFINGNNIYASEVLSKRNALIYLKELAKEIKRLHKLNIVLTDFHSNILRTNDGKLYFIDHDNFSIDNLPVDKKNVYLNTYEEQIKKFDKNFDYYMLNIYTISMFKKINTPYIYQSFKDNPFDFEFKDKEINDIFNKTMNLEESYNEDLIIDKINSNKDLRKIKRKIF